MTLADAVRRWNPWWTSGRVPPGLLGVRREAHDLLGHLLDLRHVKDVIGVRRCGKTTLMLQLVDTLLARGIGPERIVQVNLDDVALMEAGFEELTTAILEASPAATHLLVDEVQQKRGWERWIKTLYDLRRFEQIFVSGSSSSVLSLDIGRALTGRHVSVTLMPFSFREFLVMQGHDGRMPANVWEQKPALLALLNEYLEHGGLPEAVGKEDLTRQEVLVNTYRDILARDVVARHGVDAAKVHQVAFYLLSNTGKEYTLRSVARASGITADSAGTYISHLKEAFLVIELPLFTYKLRTRSRARRKAYTVDTGLRNAVALRVSSDIGRSAENAVLLELLRRGGDIHYWKGRRGEVDFVVTRAMFDVVQLVQVCWDVSDPDTRARELAGLTEAMGLFGKDEGLVITRDHEETVEVGAGTVSFVPLWRWLLEGTPGTG